MRIDEENAYVNFRKFISVRSAAMIDFVQSRTLAETDFCLSEFCSCCNSLQAGRSHCQSGVQF